MKPRVRNTKKEKFIAYDVYLYTTWHIEPISTNLAREFLQLLILGKVSSDYITVVLRCPAKYMLKRKLLVVGYS